MHCNACGEPLPDNARFCRVCGAPVSGSAAAGNGPSGGSSHGDPGRGAGSNKPLWIAVAALAVIVVALAITVPLVMARGGETNVSTVTTQVAAATTTTVPQTTTTMRPTTTDAPTTTTSAPSGPAGDSLGKWSEVTVSGLPDGADSVAVSDDTLVVHTQSGSSSKIYAYSFASGTLEEIPTGSGDTGGVDVDKNTIVWWEGTYNEATGSYNEQHIYSYGFPGGPRKEVVGGTGSTAGYPQIAGIWVTWVESSPWEASPDEYWRMPIYGAFVSVGSGSANEPQSLVPWAIASIMGDSFWVYSLGETYLAWEQAAAEGDFATGTYVLDLMDPSKKPIYLGPDAWRPSVALDKVTFWENGVKVMNLSSGEKTLVDPTGDFPTAAPTYVAYYRPSGDKYQVVARGLTGAYEQVLAETTDAPWLSPPIAASGRYVAFVTNQTLHVFEWKATTGE